MNLEKEIFDIPLTDIMPNRFQPREIFDESALEELAQSIKTHGVIQPIIVRKIGDKFEIIAGERRFRASQLAGKETIPALIRDIDNKEAAKVALLENLQRKDLNAIEEARTYQTILRLDNITQEELAENLGKSQSAIANKLRLLNLDESVQVALLNGEISERHARSLLNVDDKEKQKKILDDVIKNRLTVRQLDEEIKNANKSPLDDISFNNQLDVSQEGLLNSTMTGTTDSSNLDNLLSGIESIPVEIPSSKEDNKENNVEENNLENKENNFNIFDSLRVTNELPTEEEQKPIIAIENEVETPKEEINSNIYDIRFAINNVRQAIQNTEKFGFKVDVIETDLVDEYQFLIKIKNPNSNSFQNQNINDNQPSENKVEPEIDINNIEN